MKKSLKLCLLLPLFSLFSCSNGNDAKTIKVAASEIPHAEILNDAVKPLIEAKGYTLKVTVLDWTLQNDGVYSGDYDANYFQHRPYLQQYDSGSSTYSATYSYQNLFPTAAVHFEALRIYPGKKTIAEFETNKKTSTYAICLDVSNEIRALDLLKDKGVIDDYEKDSNGTPINLPKNITTIDESFLVASLLDYDYAVLPANTALTGGITADNSYPSESDDVKDYRANVVAASVKRYKNDEVYKAKIDTLTDALLSNEVSSYITAHYNGVLAVAQKDLR